jgi:serine protease Do
MRDKDKEDRDPNDVEKDKIDQHDRDEQPFDYEEFFREDEEEWEEEKRRQSVIRKWIIRIIAFTLSLALIANVLAIWPKVINIPAIQFLKISSELLQNENIQNYKRSIVVVEANNSKGTGFNIAPEGTIVTNHHVIDDGGNITVRFPNGKVFRAQVLTSNPDKDLAVLTIRDEGLDLPTLKLAEEKEWKKEDHIYFIGNPLFYTYIANEGRIMDTTLLKERGLEAMVIDAPIYRGNSGSPVIDQEGNVIAVIFATTEYKVADQKSKVGLAIPVSYLDKLLEDEK